LGLEPDSGPLEYASSNELLDNFLAQCAAFARGVPLRADTSLGDEDALIFEGAQGLLLDQNAPGFPYLTRSNTGFANIAAIAAEAGIEEVEPIYVTRCYLTRHGRGPMEDERDISRWLAVDDPTNKPNPWQESLRFGLLDPYALGRRIREDLMQGSIAVNPSLAVTCLDQVRGTMMWHYKDNPVENSIGVFIAALEEGANIPVVQEFRSASNDGLATERKAGAELSG
jgi:adenylosuccinate synthase